MRKSRFSESPACPYCFTEYSRDELERASGELRRRLFGDSADDLVEEIDLLDVADPAAPSGGGFSLPKPARDVFVRCPKGHDLSAVYLLPETPTYLVSLVGLRESGKTHLLVALAKLAMSEYGAELGYTVTIADSESLKTYQDLVDKVYTRREAIPFTAQRLPLGLHFRSQDREFRLLFVDIPGEAFDTDERIETDALHIAAADLHLIVLGMDVLNHARVHGATTTAFGDPTMDVVDPLLALLDRFGALVDRAREAGADATTEAVVVLNKSDMATAHAAASLSEMIGDKGRLFVPSARPNQHDVYEFDYIGKPPGANEWNAVFWHGVYGRMIIRQASSRLRLRLGQLCPRAPVSFVAPTGSASVPSESGDRQVFPIVAPTGVAALLVRVLFRLGAITPPESHDPDNVVGSWLRQLRSIEGSRG